MNALTRRLVVAGLCLLVIVASGCTFSLMKVPAPLAANTSAPPASAGTPTSMPRAQSVFMVQIPKALAGGESLGLELLDEVTGLALNAELYPMQQLDDVTHTATLALPHRSIVKYRYVRLGAGHFPEDTALDDPIRYRLYVATGPAEIRDVVSGWSDQPNVGTRGSIQGQVLNADTGSPIPDIMVAAAGQTALTDSAGRFKLQGVGVGTHNLVAYALDGTYQTFQQGAAVAAGLNTTVELGLHPSPLVRVTFVASAPGDVQGAPVRIAGNLLELGNSFADLEGGLSTVPERMPVMTLQPDGRYTATISLPAGTYVQYKYTLGDGFWNAEQHSGGGFRLRELIVPSQDVLIQDSVDTWMAGTSSPIVFETTVPSNTPVQDPISIQFNAYGWTQPIPMWPMGGNQWAYKLYGPLNTLGSLRYRYCRAGQCGSADDLATAGEDAQGRSVQTSLVPQDIKDTVAEWAWLGETDPGTLVAAEIGSRPAGFVAGIEWQADYRPSWVYYNPQSVQGVQALGANWIVFTPGWTYGGSSPLLFGLAPGTEPFWLDSAIMISQARAADLNVAVFPTPRFLGSSADFWAAAPRDPAWWNSWFEHYRAFALHHADLATQTGSQALVLGGEGLDPALPGGLLADGSGSNVPADADARWQAILAEARQHFSGEIWWALPFRAGLASTPFAFLREADYVYILWSYGLDQGAEAGQGDLAAEAGRLLDSEIAPLSSAVGRPAILGIAYPSAGGVRSGCYPPDGACLAWTDLSQPNNPPQIGLDLLGQADLYDAMLNAANPRPFIVGLVSRGFYPPTLLQDKSASVHGKPAADLLWYWFPRLTGVVQ